MHLMILLIHQMMFLKSSPRLGLALTIHKDVTKEKREKCPIINIMRESTYMPEGARVAGVCAYLATSFKQTKFFVLSLSKVANL